MIHKINVLKLAVYIVVAILLPVIQMQAAFYPKIMDSTPLFVIPAVIAVSMLEGETTGGVMGLAMGLVWDCGTGRVFGFNALFLMLIGIAVGLLVQFLFHNSVLTALLFTAVFTFVHEFITWFFFYYMAYNRNFGYAVLHIILPTVVLTLVFAAPIYIGARALNRNITVDEDSDVNLK